MWGGGGCEDRQADEIKEIDTYSSDKEHNNYLLNVGRKNLENGHMHDKVTDEMVG
jgi:hypothetical protein